MKRRSDRIRRVSCFAVTLAVIGQLSLAVAHAEPASRAQIRDARKPSQANCSL